MKQLLIDHPEVLNFDKERMELGPGVRKYLKEFKETYSGMVLQISRFRKIYSRTKKVSINDIKTLYELHGWTHTDTQQKSAVDFLRNVSRKYPIPRQFVDRVKKGKGIDISKVKNIEEFYEKLEQFVAGVAKLPQPESVDFDLSETGYLPVSLIHRSDSIDYVDPLLADKVNTVWTLDVSINPGLSIKDVIAKYMIDDGISEKKIKKDSILVEGTAGNTGTGMAIVAAVYGYKTILVIPDKMSRERIDRLQLLGAHTVIVPTKVSASDPKSYYTVRDHIAKKINGWQANQYDNLSNIKSHYEVTSPIIWSQTRGEVTAVIGAAGTGGTISGIGRYLKEKNPNIKVIAIDSVGSILYLLKEGYSIEEVQEHATSYKIQGFGEDIYPKNLDLEIIDQFIRIGDRSGLSIAQLLPALGYINGHSSGAAYAGLIEAVHSNIIGRNDKVVVIFPDIGFTYRHDLYDDNWMKENGFLL